MMLFTFSSDVGMNSLIIVLPLLFFIFRCRRKSFWRFSSTSSSWEIAVTSVTMITLTSTGKGQPSVVCSIIQLKVSNSDGFKTLTWLSWPLLGKCLKTQTRPYQRPTNRYDYGDIRSSKWYSNFQVSSPVSQDQGQNISLVPFQKRPKIQLWKTREPTENQQVIIKGQQVTS